MIKAYIWVPIERLAMYTMVDHRMKEKEPINFTSTFSLVRYENWAVLAVYIYIYIYLSSLTISFVIITKLFQ